MKENRMKGFALLGRATEKQLHNYKEYWSECSKLTMDIRPIKEINIKLKHLIDTGVLPQEREKQLKHAEDFEKKLIPNEKIRKWARHRTVVAFWELEMEDLLTVAEHWINYKIEKIKDGDEWSPKNKFPEYNRDWAE